MDAFAAFGLVAIAGLLFVKEAGVPVPVPGDLVVLGAGAAAARGDLDPLVAGPVIVVATIVGGTVQFALLRGRARRALLRLLTRFGVAEARLERLAERIRGRGPTAVAVARMTPGVRIVAIPASAFAVLPFGGFLAGLVTGNTVFTGAHFLLGLAVGEAAGDAIAALGPVPIVVAAAIVGLAIVGYAGWVVLRRRGRPAGAAEPIAIAPAGAFAWADAACPACLALAVADRVAGSRRYAEP